MSITSTIPTAESLAADSDDTVICLVCVQQVTLVPDKKVVAEHRYDDKNIVACFGSGFVPERNDGRDDVRRRAVKRCKELRRDIGGMRATLVSDFENRAWDFGTTVDFYASRLVPLEILERAWHQTTVEGNLWSTLRTCMDSLTGRSGALDTEFVLSLRRAGWRSWLSEVRMDLATQIAEGKCDGVELEKLLFAL